MAQEFIGSISGIGNAANNINVIDGQMDAAFIDMLLGGGNDNIHAGVVKNVLGGLQISPMPSPTTNTSNITLKSGIGFAYGYKGKMDADMTFTIPRPVTTDQTQYYWIVMQFDTTKSPNVCKVFLDYQGTDSTQPTYRTDNLLKTHGVYNLILYRLDVLLSATTSLVGVKVNSFITEFDKPHRASTVDYVTTQPEGTKNTTPASTKFVNNMVGISEIVMFANKVSLIFNKIGRNVIVNCANQGSGLLRATLINTSTNFGTVPFELRPKADTFMLLTMICDTNNVIMQGIYKIAANGQIGFVKASYNTTSGIDAFVADYIVANGIYSLD